MTDTRPRSSHECSPPDHPAPQPKPPEDTCTGFTYPDPPKQNLPPDCPGPDKDCRCPAGPASDPNCLENLIGKLTADIATAEKAKVVKTDLEAFLAKARTASQEYTKDKHEKLRKQWKEQDGQIAELIRKLVCAVPCWRCVIECYVCAFLDKMRNAENKLYGDGKIFGGAAEVTNLHDMLYWRTRDKEAKERTFNRIKTVLAAWEKPAQTIEKALADNAKLISESGKLLGSEGSKVVFDVFLRLVPLHLAIAPPATDDDSTTGIDKEYTDEAFCKCDSREPQWCCGLNVGEWTFRQRLVGAQAYLIDPNDYFKLICCLVEKSYGPAKEALSKAEAELVTLEDWIKRLKGQIENGLKSFNQDARGAIPSDLDCCDFEKDEGETGSPKQAR